MRTPSFRRSNAVSVLLALMVSFGIVVPSLACIWTYGRDIEGKRVTISGRHSFEFMIHANPEMVKNNWKSKLAEIERQLKPDSDYKLRNDHAAALIHVGEPKKAIEILQEIEKTNPNEYATAANIGTAYELSGDNEKALHWIKEGITRNPQSHEGSEWVHVKILEAKLALAKDPSWLKTHTVLGLNYGPDPRPVMASLPAVDHLSNEIMPAEAIKHVSYQLGERLQFVSPPDPVVADLLFDVANHTAVNRSLNEAVIAYEMSLKFAPARREFVQARLEFATSTIRYHETIHSIGVTMAVVCGVLALAGLYVLSNRRKQRAKDFSRVN
jgi:tetratricopeptide (TPR) repeat protein